MSEAECALYIQERQWGTQSQPRSQAIACRPRPALEYLTFGYVRSCLNLTNGKGEFATAFCWDGVAGRGVFEVNRVSSCNEGHKFAKSDNWNSRLKDMVGPDYLYAKLDGPEVLVVPLKHMGRCKYIGNFSIVVQGWYTLVAVVLMESYNAVQELSAMVPYIMKSFVGGRNLRLSLPIQGQDAHDPSSYYPPSASGLPVCQDLGVAPGRWVRPLARAGVLDRFPWKFPRVPGKNLFLPFVDQFGHSAVWTPYGRCGWRSFSQGESVQCLARRRLAFFGDSQTRSLFYPFVNKLLFDSVNRTEKIRVQDGMKRWTAQNDIILDYYPDPYLNHSEFASVLFQNGSKNPYDIVVLGLGNWPGSSSIGPIKGMWPFEKFVKHLEILKEEFVRLINANQDKVAFILHTIPAFGAADFDPWRNNERFAIYNNELVRLAEEVNKRVKGPVKLRLFDVYSMSSAMVHTSEDGAHYLNFVADFWAEALVNILCPPK